jgi:hypothetical protein
MTEHHSLFKSPAPKLSKGSLSTCLSLAFDRLANDEKIASWSSEALHTAEGVAAIYHVISWAVDPSASNRMAEAATVVKGTDEQPTASVCNSSDQQVRMDRCSSIILAVCKDVLRRGDVGVRLLCSLWMKREQAGATQLLKDLTEQLVQSAAIDLTANVPATLVADIACSLPHNCLTQVLDVVQRLLSSAQDTHIAAGFDILNTYKHRRPHCGARLLQFCLCVAHMAEAEVTRSTAIKTVAKWRGANDTYVTQFVTSVALSLARAPRSAIGTDDTWKDQQSLLLPHCTQEERTSLESEAATLFARGVTDVADARRRVQAFFHVSSRVGALLQLVPWLYCHVVSIPSSTASSSSTLAAAVREVLVAEAARLLKFLTRKHAVHHVLEKMRFETGLGVLQDGMLDLGQHGSVALPGCIDGTIHSSPHFIVLVQRVLALCTEDIAIAPKSGPASVAEWGKALRNPLHEAPLPVETIQATLRIATVAKASFAELQLMLPLLKFLPAADMLALVPHYLRMASQGDMEVADLFQRIGPGTSSCSVDPAVLLAWVMLSCSVSLPTTIQVAGEGSSTGPGGRFPGKSTSLAKASAAAESSSFFARMGSAEELPLDFTKQHIPQLLTNPALFQPPMVWSALGLLADVTPPPTMLMFWFLHTLEFHNSEIMKQQISSLLLGLIRRGKNNQESAWKMWEIQDVWRGFLRVATRTIPSSLPVLLQLPDSAFVALVEGNAALQKRLSTFAADVINQSNVAPSILHILGIEASGHAARDLQPTPSALVAAVAAPSSTEVRVGGRKRAANSSNDSRSILRPRSE